MGTTCKKPWKESAGETRSKVKQNNLYHILSLWLNRNLKFEKNSPIHNITIMTVTYPCMLLNILRFRPGILRDVKEAGVMVSGLYFGKFC